MGYSNQCCIRPRNRQFGYHQGEQYTFSNISSKLKKGITGQRNNQLVFQGAFCEAQDLPWLFSLGLGGRTNSMLHFCFWRSFITFTYFNYQLRVLVKQGSLSKGERND